MLSTVNRCLPIKYSFLDPAQYTNSQTGTKYGGQVIAQLKADLLELETFLHAHSISFAPILIDLSFTTQLFQFGHYTDEVYYEGAIDWINEVNSSIGQPDHLIFESWARPQYSDTDLISITTPINLPEDDTTIFSHTRLINEGFTIFNPPSLSCCDLPGDFSDDGRVDVSDLTAMVDFMFGGGAAAPCQSEADVDRSGTLDVADLTYFVAYLFGGGSEPPPCL